MSTHNAAGVSEEHAEEEHLQELQSNSSTEELQPTREEASDDLADDSTAHRHEYSDDDKRDGQSRRDSGASKKELGDEAEPGENDNFVAPSSSESPRQSFGGESEAGQSQLSEGHDAEHAAHTDDDKDGSSHNDHEDDVFSDHSPRSSMGSLSESDRTRFSPQKVRSPRISDIPHSDQDDDFVPTIRGAPRPPFRSPSSVKAIQMSSPPASVIGSPRSSRRTPRPTVSRLGSPSVSAQYSPKKTPPRFKRNTPPLVLLHVTVMPLRWPWGHVLDNAHPGDLSPECKTLWDSWKQLQDRTTDTVSDRGILLPHPQNDYEVLEERLLETLELPLRRRARILECGHYLGPSNVMSLTEDGDEEHDEEDNDENRYPRESLAHKIQTHWCTTCHSDIKYDSLGAGKIYRVKVYASNGLMRAGAWEACWKEMERVDVEMEPLVDPKLQEELSYLAAEQERALDMEEEAAAAAAAAAVDEEIQLREEAERKYLAAEQEEALDMENEEAAAAATAADEECRLREEAERNYMAAEQEGALDMEEEEATAAAAADDDDDDDDEEIPSEHVDAPPQPEAPVEDRSTFDHDRRLRDEERLREIYGHSPRPHAADTCTSEPTDPQAEYTPHQTPPSPPVEAFERRQQRHGERRDTGTDKNVSLPDLLLEAAKVLLQDQKNVMIGLLSLLVLVFAVRSGRSPEQANSFNTNVSEPVGKISVDQASQPVAQPAIDKTAETLGRGVEVANGQPMPRAGDGCVACSKSLEVAEMSLKAVPVSVVEVISTMTKEAYLTATTTVVETVSVEAMPPEMTPAEVISTVTEKAYLTVTETVVETVSVGATSAETPAAEAAVASGSEVREDSSERAVSFV
ncbi:uncharacterized protein UV8b_06102 [Ustilaginoidea virens]|uniref:Pathway-specific nitrogen regulator n=1 Tax=Ustilaginoidea virens TaxID=1159556 RepID=A0A8E5MJI7_USTVR|nr:uncharacterized protein UV8b_06102 [Ustilaginoidea virens]QUC21861.1 hypothetical protein UV8b_06102 [Ustilaginoidea virens]